ncbi:MAG: cadherin-like domain-containing protein, partial [Thiomargarita sp.]|nr:cadherin-like domain-containing protein [Thiomargarita sp.]
NDFLETLPVPQQPEPQPVPQQPVPQQPVPVPQPAISGQVRLDSDADGDLGDDESGISNVIVELWSDPNGDGDASDGTLLNSVTTDNQGNYSFNHLHSGHYVLKENNPAHHSSTTDSDGSNNDQIAVTLTTNDTHSANNDFLDAPLPLNQKPTANDDSYFVNKNNTLTIVTSNGILVDGLDNAGGDTDHEGNILTTTLITTTEHGSVKLETDGTFTYKPVPEFTGIDTFTYQISDGNGGTDTAIVTITVNPQPAPEPMLVPVEDLGQVQAKHDKLPSSIRQGYQESSEHYQTDVWNLSRDDVSIDSRLVRVLNFGSATDMPVNQYVHFSVNDWMPLIYRQYGNGEMGEPVRYGTFVPMERMIHSLMWQSDYWQLNGGEALVMDFSFVKSIDHFWRFQDYQSANDNDLDQMDCGEEGIESCFPSTFGEELAQADPFEIERDMLLSQLADLLEEPILEEAA